MRLKRTGSSPCPARLTSRYPCARTPSPTAIARTRCCPTPRKRSRASTSCRKWWNDMTDLTHLTLADALKGLKKKDFSAKEITEAHIRAVESVRHLNCFVTETPDIALKQAAASDARRAKGNALPLDGAPLAIKDLFCTKGVKTTASSKILGNFIPPYESTVSGKLLGDGAVMLGKTSLDEFAMGSSNTTSAFGNVISPWKRKDGSNVDLV